ncbi:hypothetical protein CHLNCDRAFT_145574 [Chlorella variabilis]|uniref:Glycosyltransferase 2-like domain-containing protein n=1 Tax=Chlorella variabilis TaxID=554065 RepID=E1ZDS4_CHLVA|nr:hypothetical protein CHLNCDRAFT_145574 [Chlorella variabilis]EFN56074.1 hypothetical protein CHLNCDRAFT_145574 [Chlorella variabilis]|eukprot:XP_005848176.1 hypothetical protein CHLNCDRAFT_145574 [Chlorella variabilis]
MCASLGHPLACRAGPFAARRKFQHRQRSPRCAASGDGGGRGGGSSGGGSGGGDGSGGGRRRTFPLPLLYAAVWAVGTEALAALQYQEAVGRDAERRAELFGGGRAGRARHQQRQRAKLDPEAPAVSIIVPTLNEEAGLARTLRCLQHGLQPAAAEVIVVDGGSSDRTVQVARRCGARVVQAGRGRARQMNAGAAAASGDIFVFAHADTTPPRTLVEVVRRTLARPAIVLGAFRPVIEYEGQPLRFFSANNTMKTYYGPLLLRPLSFLRGLRCLFGDQTLFCRADDFRRVGGYDSRLPIMEDADLCMRMHMAGPADRPGRRGQVLQVNSVPNRTSGRRLASWGSLHATVVHVAIGMSWYCGATPEQLRGIYNRMYTDAFR